MWKKLTEERGVAMVTAILASMVVLLLGLVVVEIANHNSNQSSYDRNRTMAIDAAEAGLDTTMLSLQTSPTASLPCTVDNTLPTTPAVKNHVVINYYATYPPTGSPLPCPPSSTPAGATITSTGTAVVTAAPVAVSRTMETQVRLTPIYGGFGPALFSDTGLDLQNNLTVNGNQGNDGDVYTNGNWTCNNNSNIHGSVFVQGTATMTSSCTVAQDVRVNGDMTMTQSATVSHDVVSSVGSLTMSNNTKVLHNARTGTTCTGCAGRVSGTITQSSVSPPPPHLDFPTINYDQAAWQGAGYSIQNYASCALAQTAINAGWIVPTVARVTPACALAWGNNTVINVRSDLAIITDGSVTTNNQVTFASADGKNHLLYIIVPKSAASTCPTSGVTHDVSFSQQTSFDGKISLFVYSPCHVAFANNNNGQGGQIYGGTVDVTNLYSLTFFTMLVPGAGTITGYRVDIAFLREVKNP